MNEYKYLGNTSMTVLNQTVKKPGDKITIKGVLNHPDFEQIKAKEEQKHVTKNK